MVHNRRASQKTVGDVLVNWLTFLMQIYQGPECSNTYYHQISYEFTQLAFTAFNKVIIYNTQILCVRIGAPQMMIFPIKFLRFSQDWKQVAG